MAISLAGSLILLGVLPIHLFVQFGGLDLVDGTRFDKPIRTGGGKFRTVRESNKASISPTRVYGAGLIAGYL